MSWIKKRGQAGTPNSSAAPPVQMYNPNQHSNIQNQWQMQNFQPPSANNWYPQNANDSSAFAQPPYNSGQQSQQYWQQHGQGQETQMQNQQHTPQNYSHYTYQSANFSNHSAVQPSQQQYGYYGQQSHQQLAQPQHQQLAQPQHQQQQQQSQQLTQQQTEPDSWSSWGWGEESGQGQEVQSNIAENFTNDETWNWSVEEANSSTSLQGHQTQSNAVTNENTYGAGNVRNSEQSPNELFPKVGQAITKHNQNSKSQSPGNEGENQNLNLQTAPNSGRVDSKTMVKKSSKTDMLPAQWSTESQVSQDSSENIQTSESNSRMLSRSSTTSESSLPIQDLTQTNSENVQDTHQNTNNEVHNNRAIKNDPIDNYGNRNFHNEEQSQHENVEILSNVQGEPNSSKVFSTPPPPIRNQTNPTPPLPKSQTNPTPPPPAKNHTPPLMPPQSSLDDFKNPYKRTTGLSHRAANKFKMESQPLQPSSQNQMHFPPTPFQQSVNLETLPDNSEQPDSYPLQSTQLVRKVSMSKPPLPHCPDNNEIAPINDRNQYLETGQLSNSEVMADNNDALPPPGLQRMVLGQMEYNEQDIRQEDQSDNQVEEPPPGLSRMVLGQNVNTVSSKAKSRGSNEISEPPVGLHRMVPGESSSPENSKWNKGMTKRSGTRREPSVYQESDQDTYPSDVTPIQPSQTRSATIGADTPPIPSVSSADPSNLNKNNLDIGVDLKNDRPNADSENGNGKIRDIIASSDNGRRTTGADRKISPSEGARRESIEGQPEETEIGAIINAVRDMTVGENVDDSSVSKTASDRPQRKQSVQESSDSDSRREDVSKKGRDYRDRDRDKDRRYRDESGYERVREKSKRYSPSPDRYGRDKKYDRRKYRDRRYEEDTDYYSDKEKDRRRDQRDKYDDYRKYSSLRKDKYREKQRRDPRELPREGKRGDYYYGHYEDDYEDASRSRPSSRSDSLHESYRDRGHTRDRHRDRDRHRRHRDHRDPYMQMQGYPYDPFNPYYQQLQYQYYENLRRTNPQAYAEWYRKYYQNSGTQQVYGEEERASVHSGRSSANDELAKDRYTRQSFYSQSSYPHVGDYYREAHSISGHYGHSESRIYDRTDSSLNLEENATVSQRLTPAKFTTAHLKVCISSGLFVKIQPHYPLDGQAAIVEVGSFQDYLQNDDEYKELSQFPGPLVKGVTHKKTIIEYCESKIRSAILDEDINDTDSYILMYELMILLLRQNGMVVGTDIAELLMKDRKNATSRRPSIASNASSAALERTESLNNLISDASSTPALKEEIVTNKFRDYLLYGSGKEALEWAMKHGLWGHALFLASKLDKRTYANVMTRFANGLPMNDPLQTLYQLLSGKLPAAVTCVADEKWGDWRPHLAMILSNTTQRPDLDRKAITTLADTLFNRGNLYAAQFCYLMAQIGFSRYGMEGARLVLLGANHTKPFMQFATNDAIHLTEIYEYACSLNDPAFTIPEFQVYKYLIATRLTDRGILEKGLAYLEKVANTILQNPVEYQPSLIANVCKLADRLKYCDPVVVEDPDADIVDYNSNRADNTWLKDLRILESNYNMGLINQNGAFVTDSAGYASQTNQQVYDSQYVTAQEPWQQQQQQLQQYTEQLQYQQSSTTFESWQSGMQSEQSQNNLQEPQQQLQHDQQKFEDGYSMQQYGSEQQQFWQNQQQQQQQQQWPGMPDQPSSENQLAQQPNEQEQSQNIWNNAQSEDVPRPQISMPNQTKGRRTIFDDQDENDGSKPAQPASPAKPKLVAPQKQDKPATTGWFGGIWNKLSLKPKNQMKLPDDKNPTIVWDETKKRWVNLDEDGDGGSTEIKPPPKMSDLVATKPPPTTPTPPFNPRSLDYQNANQNNNRPVATNNYNINNNNFVNQNSQPLEDNITAKPPQPNMFKLQRGRNIKKSYVDVFNPGGKSAAGSTASTIPDPFNAATYNPAQMNFFVPAPVNDPNKPTDFLTPGPVQQQTVEQPQ